MSLDWEMKGRGLQRTWTSKGELGEYTIYRQILDGHNLYLIRLKHDKNHTVRFPICSKLTKAKLVAQKYENTD